MKKPRSHKLSTKTAWRRKRPKCAHEKNLFRTNTKPLLGAWGLWWHCGCGDMNVWNCTKGVLIVNWFSTAWITIRWDVSRPSGSLMCLMIFFVGGKSQNVYWKHDNKMSLHFKQLMYVVNICSTLDTNPNQWAWSAKIWVECKKKLVNMVIHSMHNMIGDTDVGRGGWSHEKARLINE